MEAVIGIDLAEIGLTDKTGEQSSGTDKVAAPEDAGTTLVRGSVMARALYSVWSGTPVTIVDSPPGAGKTTLLVEMVKHLMDRVDLEIVVATPTRNAAYDIAHRMGDALGMDEKGLARVILGVRGMETDSDTVAVFGNAAKGAVMVRTVASCKIRPPECDLLILDEAYQSTFADSSLAADSAVQVLMVGDPGQIGPVVQGSDQMFAGRAVSPSMRAPEVFRQVHESVELNLTTTYRLGAQTVQAIAPLYDFEFTSSRPDRWLEDDQGERIEEITGLQVAPVTSYTDVAPVQSAVDHAASLVGATLAEQQEDGTVVRRRLAQSDICVVAPHNAQVTAAAGMLSAQGLDRVTVGTADSLQGGQWHAVVALDPLIGHETAGIHQLSPGRLCVMASRHLTAMVWVHQRNWADALLSEEIAGREADLGRLVRSRLTSGKVTVND